MYLSHTRCPCCPHVPVRLSHKGPTKVHGPRQLEAASRNHPSLFAHVALSLKNAAEFFQVSIDISLDLLAGRSTSGGGGATEGMVLSDAVDLASTYNRLGLALGDSGSDVLATKEAFLAGLSAAPDDLALLVNGGAAHQARAKKTKPQELMVVWKHQGSHAMQEIVSDVALRHRCTTVCASWGSAPV